MTDKNDASGAASRACTRKKLQTIIDQELMWDGQLDANVLKGDIKGAALYAALQNRARQLGHTLQEMCEFMGFSYPYYAQLRSGRRSLNGSQEEFTAACARYLGVPRLTVLMLAEVVTPEDMYIKPHDIVRKLPDAFEQVCSDPDWAPLATPAVKVCEPSTQFFIVRLYEQLTQTPLLPDRVEPVELTQAFLELRKIREGLLRT